MSRLALFAAGLFFGGAIDHAILGATGKRRTPYGVRVGKVGNWELAAFDGALTLILVWMHRRLERRN